MTDKFYDEDDEMKIPINSLYVFILIEITKTVPLLFYSNTLNINHTKIIMYLIEDIVVYIATLLYKKFYSEAEEPYKPTPILGIFAYILIDFIKIDIPISIADKLCLDMVHYIVVIVFLLLVLAKWERGTNILVDSILLSFEKHYPVNRQEEQKKSKQYNINKVYLFILFEIPVIYLLYKSQYNNTLLGLIYIKDFLPFFLANLVKLEILNENNYKPASLVFYFISLFSDFLLIFSKIDVLNRLQIYLLVLLICFYSAFFIVIWSFKWQKTKNIFIDKVVVCNKYM